MPETAINTINVDGRSYTVQDSLAAELDEKKSNLKRTSYQYREITTKDSMDIGVKLRATPDLYTSVYDKFGSVQQIGDPGSVDARRSMLILETLLTGWSRADDIGQPLPLTPDNIATLPPAVASELASRLSGGIGLTIAEVEALKKKPSKPTDTTSTPTV